MPVKQTEGLIIPESYPGGVYYVRSELGWLLEWM